MLLVRKVDDFLNGITMYRLVLYGLMVIAFAGLLNSLVGTLSLPIGGMLLSLILAVSFCWLTNKLLSSLRKIAPNDESWLITALILFCVMPPATTTARIVAIVLASIVSIAPRYLVAIRGKHALNPAAAGIFTVAVLGIAQATWWVGTPVMLPFTLIVGLLVVRKLRRFSMLFSFVAATLVGLAVWALLNDRSVMTVLSQAVFSGPLLFLGTIMLTEPSTMPPRFRAQLIYGALVGVLLASHLEWWVFGTTPETALLVGNLFAYAVSPQYRLKLRLVKKTQLSDRVYDFAFASNRKAEFQPGQYMEWTLPLDEREQRGNRRTFTIASSPTEQYVHVGVKFYEPSSAFKKALRQMEVGDELFAGQIAGDFTLPKDPTVKLGFIAGGIGITPFRSMVSYLVDRADERDIVLFYVVSDPAELSYRQIFEEARAIGLRLVPVLTADVVPEGWRGKTGFLDASMVQESVPDALERTWYVSGPNAMVERYAGMLKTMGVARKRVKTDHFSGY